MLRICLNLSFVLALAAAVPAAESSRVDYNFQIRPLLSDRCFKCHGPDEKARKKKLRLDTREGMFKELDEGWAVVRPGDTNRSELLRRIFTDNEDDIMPRPDSNLTLTPAEKDLLLRWVAEGAEFKPPWSLIPVAKVSPPAPRNDHSTKNPIDAFIRARLEKENLAPAPAASRETLLRRIAFDLPGLPPSVAEMDAFLADTSPSAYEHAVEKYLGSPAYGERMAMDWLDLARYADTYGYQADVERDMSAWRDWVIRAFNDNLPYDQFLTWQLAGDLLPNATRDQRLATAFNRLHRQTNEGGSVEEEFRVDYVSDRVNTVGTAMLGLTVGCAKCHDHKYDPIKQRDYYSLSAFFNNIDESGLYSHFTSATPTPTQLLWPADKEKQHAELKSKIADVESKLKIIGLAATNEFETWLKTAEVKLPAPIAHFAFDSVTNNHTPDSVSTNQAKLEDEPLLVDGALKFSGDNAVTCPKLKPFLRSDSFTFSIRLKPMEKQDRAVILHQSKAWTDAGSRGFELTLDHGKPFFGLIHFWPGNAMAVRAKAALPTNEWAQITVTYDGSSHAAGIRLYLNGAAVETEIVRDHLYKDISYSGSWQGRYSGNDALKLAARFRDNGFKNGLIDDLQVFDVALTGAEARRLAGLESNLSAGNSKGLLLEHYLMRENEAARSAFAELKQLREEENKLVYEVPEIMVMEEMPTERVTHLLQRGAYDAPGDIVPRDTPAAVLPFPKDQPRNRLGLAHWMTDRQNPLTARVIVNRIWRMHFGRGLVATEQDFGSQGKLPTHPELLEWLAGWFMDGGWDVKALHRLIVNSATYQQSSQASRELIERDPDNTLLARGPKHRLQAEQIRDSALAASGLLVKTIGGPSVKPYQPAGLWEQSGTGKTYTQDHGESLYRRSLYTFWRRTSPPPSLLTFDAVTREVCTANRETTTTPLQALVLLNDPQFIEAARVLGEKLLKKYPDNLDARFNEAFRLLTGRQPDEKETAVLRQLFDEQKTFYARDAEAAKKILATGESKWDETLPRAEFAATTMLVSAVMNFEEFVMER